VFLILKQFSSYISERAEVLPLSHQHDFGYWLKGEYQTAIGIMSESGSGAWLCEDIINNDRMTVLRRRSARPAPGQARDGASVIEGGSQPAITLDNYKTRSQQGLKGWNCEIRE
jgi:hypothetical protein